ncbi:hypothetical protein Bca52824_058008 [Brassica carinata]|uniref:DUF1985 domain-containing protein n=1 Tax=Brassica carinata TaxID=52824 RepID=A0A8X7QS24_BRACI|nr:hypothetical protein Bca52824_058008 [Brassica carinata]
MEELGLPERLINNYFNLRWIEVVKTALSDAQQKLLLLSRQLVTKKLYELWWLFTGKSIRYGIGDFVLVTGLNCGTPPTLSLGGQRMGKGEKKDKSKGKQLGGDGAILCRLGQKDKYKDEDTRLRLSLLLLVEGIICPTSGLTPIRPEVVEMVSNIGLFMDYPWGRDSFLLTVSSGKIRSAGQLAQDTLAIQGFSHAMVLVTVCSCPQIIAESRLGEDLVNDELPTEDIVDGVCARSVKINVVTVQNLELIGQATVCSILCEVSDIPPIQDEVEDLQVAHMVSLIRDGFPFEINTWHGHAGGCGQGVNLDVPNLVRVLAKELHARGGPLLATLRTHISREMLLLKEEVLAASRVSSQGAMQDPAGGDGGISNCIPRNNGHGIQTTTSTFPSDLTATFQVPSPGAQLGGKDGGTLASSDEAPSEFDNTTVRKMYTIWLYADHITPADSGDQHPSLPDAFKDDVATSGTDGVEDEPPARSGDNLDKGPAVDEDNVNLASSEPSYKAAAPQPIQMEVQHPPSSSPTSATDDPSHLVDTSVSPLDDTDPAVGWNTSRSRPKRSRGNTSKPISLSSCGDEG